MITKIGRFIWILGVLVTVAGLFFLFIESGKLSQDILSWHTIALQSSNPNDIAEYLRNFEKGLIKWGMTEGFSDPVFRTPEHDMKLFHRRVQQLIKDAELLTQLDKNSEVYQSGLRTITDKIEKLHIRLVDEYWRINQGLVYFILFIGGILMFLLGLFLNSPLPKFLLGKKR